MQKIDLNKAIFLFKDYEGVEVSFSFVDGFVFNGKFEDIKKMKKKFEEYMNRLEEKLFEIIKNSKKLTSKEQEEFEKQVKRLRVIEDKMVFESYYRH